MVSSVVAMEVMNDHRILSVCNSRKVLGVLLHSATVLLLDMFQLVKHGFRLWVPFPVSYITILSLSYVSVVIALGAPI